MEDSLKVNFSNESTGRDFIAIYRFGSNPSTEIVEVENSCERSQLEPIFGGERLPVDDECSGKYLDPFTGQEIDPNLDTEFTDPLTGEPLDDLTINVTNDPLPYGLEDAPVYNLTAEEFNEYLPGISNPQDAFDTTKNILSLVPDGINIKSFPNIGARVGFTANLVGRNIAGAPDFITAGSDGLGAAFYMIGQTNNVFVHINNSINPSTLFSNYNR